MVTSCESPQPIVSVKGVLIQVSRLVWVSCKDTGVLGDVAAHPLI